MSTPSTPVYRCTIGDHLVDTTADSAEEAAEIAATTYERDDGDDLQRVTVEVQQILDVDAITGSETLGLAQTFEHWIRPRKETP